jgi:hypothetical protein
MWTRELAKVLATVALSCGWAIGQVAPPPGPAPAPTPSFDPPPPAPPEPQFEPVEVKPAEPDPAYDPIVKRDAAGALIPIVDRSVEEAALAANTRIKTDEQRAQVEEFLAERRRRAERVLIENLDVVAKIDAGGLDSLDMGNKEQMGQAQAIANAVYLRKSAAAELRDTGVIDDPTLRFNNKIVSEYRTAANEEMLKAIGDDATARARAQFAALMRQGSEEVMLARRRLLLEAADRMDLVLAGLPGDAVSKLGSLKGALPADPQQRYTTLRDAVKALPTEAQKAFFEKVLATRG